MITKAQAVAATHHNEFVHVSAKQADKRTPVRCRVNGKCQIWKTRPEEFKLPVKYGLYQSFYITQDNAKDWSVANDNTP